MKQGERETMSTDNQPTQETQLPESVPLPDSLLEPAISIPGEEAPKLGRRRLLQMLTITGAGVAADLLVPAEWVGPAVDVGWLPAHAAGSGTPVPTYTPTPTPMLTPTPPPPPTGNWSKERILIPAGPFVRGWPSPPIGAPEDYSPQKTITLSAFYIDKYPVTNARFAEAVAAGACSPPDSMISRTRYTAYYKDPMFRDYPVIWITWLQAYKFCQWAGGRLPTEAEWEKAARGTDGRLYPWGNADPKTSMEYANFDNRVRDTTPVYQYPKGASPYGVMDMAGNVAEWVSDYYDRYYYSDAPTTDPPGPTQTIFTFYRTVRGGNFTTPAALMEIFRRVYVNTYVSPDYVGFRCVYPVTAGAAAEAAETPVPVAAP